MNFNYKKLSLIILSLLFTFSPVHVQAAQPRNPHNPDALKGAQYVLGLAKCISAIVANAHSSFETTSAKKAIVARHLISAIHEVVTLINYPSNFAITCPWLGWDIYKFYTTLLELFDKQKLEEAGVETEIKPDRTRLQRFLTGFLAFMQFIENLTAIDSYSLRLINNSAEKEKIHAAMDMCQGAYCRLIEELCNRINEDSTNQKLIPIILIIINSVSHSYFVGQRSNIVYQEYDQMLNAKRDQIEAERQELEKFWDEIEPWARAYAKNTNRARSR